MCVFGFLWSSRKKTPKQTLANTKYTEDRILKFFLCLKFMVDSVGSTCLTTMLNKRQAKLKGEKVEYACLDLSMRIRSGLLNALDPLFM